MMAYEVHLRDTISDPMADLEEAMRMVEEAGHGMLLSMVQETIWLPFEVKQWKTAAAWGYSNGQWYAIEMHGWSDGKQPVTREEVG